jgi:hypothetical protein
MSRRLIVRPQAEAEGSIIIKTKLTLLFNEVLAELPSFTVAERQLLIRCAWTSMSRPYPRKMKPWWKSVWQTIAAIPIPP